MGKLGFLLVVMLVLSSCYKDAQSSTQAGNFKVEFLFESDGCKVYRFLDGGRPVYFSNCKGRIDTEWTEKSGNTTTTEETQTLNSGQ